MSEPQIKRSPPTRWWKSGRESSRLSVPAPDRAAEAEARRPGDRGIGRARRDHSWRDQGFAPGRVGIATVARDEYAGIGGREEGVVVGEARRYRYGGHGDGALAQVGAAPDRRRCPARTSRACRSGFDTRGPRPAKTSSSLA